MKKEDKKLFIIVALIFIIWFLSIVIATRNKIIVKEGYVENLEEKINILTIEYERFSLEDSLR